MDGTETQVRRPWANRPGRRAFISGKRRQNTIKTTTISDHQGRALFSGAQRPGRMRDRSATRRRTQRAVARKGGRLMSAA
ncbi:transposase family protein [Streptomyces sp. NPDC002346]